MKLLKAINLSIMFILSLFSFLEINRADGSSTFESEPPKACLRSVLPSGLISITGSYRRHYENGINYISREDLEIGLSMYHRAMADKEQLTMIENQDELRLIQWLKNDNSFEISSIVSANNIEKYLLSAVYKLAPHLALNYFLKRPDVGLEFDELVQVAMIGLFRALREYKPEVNVAFSTYAYYYMRNEIMNLLRIDSNQIVSKSSVIDRENKLFWAYSKWINEHMGVAPTVDDLYNFLKEDQKAQEYQMSFSKENIEHMLMLRKIRKSVTSIIPYDIADHNGDFVGRGEIPSIDLIASDELTYEELVDLQKLKDEVKRIIDTRGFTKIERDVIYLYFGLDSYSEGLSLTAIGSVLDLSVERIRHTKERALRKLRHPSRSNSLEEFY